MKCSKCGFETNKNFCEKCGNRIGKKDKLNTILGVGIIILLIIGSAFSVMFLKTKKEQSNKEIPTMYVFYAGYCHYCTALHDYLDNTLLVDAEYKNKFKVKYIQIANETGLKDETNDEMFRKVAEYYNYSKGGIPFYVIGNNYMSGYSEALEPKIKKIIDEAYSDSDYKDMVASLIDVNKINEY